MSDEALRATIRRKADEQIASEQATPRFIGIWIWLQILLGVGVMTLLLTSWRPGQEVGGVLIRSVLPVSMILAGAGMQRRSVWGWWGSCSVLFFLLLCFGAVGAAAVFGVARVNYTALGLAGLIIISILYYLYQGKVTAYFISARGAGVREALFKLSPPAAGFAAALLLNAIKAAL